MVFNAFPSGCKEHLSGLRFYVALPAHRPSTAAVGEGTRHSGGVVEAGVGLEPKG